MLRRLYRFMARLSPFLSIFIRESYYTLNGWRFLDLKEAIARNHGTSPTLSLEWTLADANNIALPNDSRMAFVTCLPPDKTGIATCSLYSWLKTSRAVDIFCPPQNDDWFFALHRYLERESKGKARVLDVNGFLSADMSKRYEFIVIAVGNSHHNAYVIPLIKKLSTFGSLERVTLYLHDPCCLNLLEDELGLGAVALSKGLSYFAAIYPEVMRSSGARFANLAGSGVMGIRYFYQKGIRRYIVNSEAALRLVEADIGSDDVFIDKLFHPIFSPIEERTCDDTLDTITTGIGGNQSATKMRNEQDVDLRIGTFGIPGPDKCTDLVLQAVSIMAKQGVRAHLTMAGYNVRQYYATYAGDLAKIPHTLVDAPTDLQLWTLMSRIDLAVQLRSNNRGESSGIVAQLIKLNKPMILSDVGSFSEIGKAFERGIICVPPRITSQQLAERIVALMKSENGVSLFEQYATDRCPAKWRDRLYAILRSRAPGNGAMLEEASRPSAGLPRGTNEAPLEVDLDSSSGPSRRVYSTGSVE